MIWEPVHIPNITDVERQRLRRAAEPLLTRRDHLRRIVNADIFTNCLRKRYGRSASANTDVQHVSTTNRRLDQSEDSLFRLLQSLLRLVVGHDKVGFIDLFLVFQAPYRKHCRLPANEWPGTMTAERVDWRCASFRSKRSAPIRFSCLSIRLARTSHRGRGRETKTGHASATVPKLLLNDLTPSKW
jgi:hypothetical protein